MLPRRSSDPNLQFATVELRFTKVCICDGHGALAAAAAAAAAFDSSHIQALAAINARYEAKTARQKNPHPHASMGGLPGSSPASADGTYRSDGGRLLNERQHEK